jgi:hypothetical protein
MEIFVEDWMAAYGSPYLVAPDDGGAPEVKPVEDGDDLRSHRGIAPDADGGHAPLAFIDGVRRGEAALYQYQAATGQMARGVAGSHACGAVVADGRSRPRITDERVTRTVIWGSGALGSLPAVPGGWEWVSTSIAADAPEAPLMELQTRMRQQEAMLAEEMSERGRLVVVDGPLSYVRGRDRPVVGYVKTHHKALLAPALHARVPELRAGERTSLFRLGRERYSCYLRIAPTGGFSGPWAGIVRLEVPQSAGLTAAIEVVDEIGGILPRYAGVAHRDPRAPQNLQPVGALESHLRHLLGDGRLAFRAVRAAVAAAPR